MLPDEPLRAPVFSEAMSELTDGDLAVEVTAKPTRDTEREVVAVQPVEEAVQASYRALAGSIEMHFETVAILEEVPKRCSTIWLQVHTHEARKEDGLNSDPSLLKYLAQGTLAIIAWMDGSSNLRLADLQKAMRVLAWGTSATTSTHPAAPRSADLVNAIAAWQKAKDALRQGDRARIITQHGSAELDLTKNIPDPAALLLDKKLVNRSADMIFVVEVPDYQSTGHWQLKHGEAHIIATCEPGTLLDRFYRRELDIRPGDALHCQVEFDTSYGPDHEVVAERLRVVQVLEVLPPSGFDSERSQDRDDQRVAAESVKELNLGSLVF